MKLLTWMHRKFRQGGTETLKEYPLGQPSLDDSHLYQKQNHTNGMFRQVHRDGHQAQKSFGNLETTKLEDLEAKATAEFSEFFEGFLAIGTLGTDAGISEPEPETPTFAEAFEKLAEGETEVTENEMRLISDGFESVFAAEAKDDGWTDSSSRNSHVSNGRISHASTITLSGKPLEISETGGTGNSVCPLQEYLLGSAVEFPEKPAVPKKENRTSLGELFERHKAEESFETKYKRGEKREDKESEKNAINLMKKMLKKKIVNATSSDMKLCKILQKFHRRVHPESLTSTQKSGKPHKTGIKDMIPCNAGYYKDMNTFLDENIMSSSHRAHRNGYIHDSKNHSSPTQDTPSGSDSNGSRECWIKSDADYLVLEL